MSGVGAVFGVEWRKLVAQPRLRFGLAVVLVAPWLFIALVLHQDRLPVETLYGRYLKDSGFATPLVVLVFATQWIFPLVASLISGDVFSSEDAHGTWKTVLTRSVSRSAVFWGKVAAAFSATTAAVVVLGTSATLAGVVLVGAHPLVDVGGVLVPASAALGHVALSWLVVLPPVLAFAALAIAVSVLTRSSVLGVVVPVVIGLVMQMYVFLNAWDTVRHLLLNTPMNAWRGLFDAPAYVAPLERGLLVALAYLVGGIVVALVAFRRRDVSGG
jgi:ABC-2 type transport system permease protein